MTFRFGSKTAEPDGEDGVQARSQLLGLFGSDPDYRDGATDHRFVPTLWYDADPLLAGQAAAVTEQNDFVRFGGLKDHDFKVLPSGFDHLDEKAAVVLPRLTVYTTGLSENLRVVFPLLDPAKLLPHVTGVAMRHD